MMKWKPACSGLHNVMRHDRRQTGKLSELKFGLECGGSDGFSGITANPLLGCFSDQMIANGGTTVLTEVPEMFGAERILMSRCRDAAIFDKTVAMINDFKRYFIDHQQPIYENPSPGNRRAASPRWRRSRWLYAKSRAESGGGC